MKKFYSLLMVLGVLSLLYPNQATGQTYTYDVSKSSANAGNPGGLKTDYDYITTGWTKIHDAYSSGGSTTNTWSSAVALPFSFEFYGTSVDSFCVSKNGLLTFSTSVAGSTVNSNLNTNRALPYSNVPDSSIAYFWEDKPSSSWGTNDEIYMRTYGTTGSRQCWIWHYSYRHGSMSYAYFALVLEEGSNKMYVVDMNYKSGNGTMTIGTQLSSSTATQVTSGINSSAGSPNIIFGTGSTPPTDNEYYILTPRKLVTDNMSIVDIANPTGAVCSTADSVKVNVQNDGTNTVSSFDVTGIAEGVYFVTLKNGAYTATQRVVITR